MNLLGGPKIGTHVEVRRPGDNREEGMFEQAVVVQRLTDPCLGVVLELQFEDSKRMQRVWPSSTIRLVA